MKKSYEKVLKKVLSHLKGDHKTWKMFQEVAKEEDNDDKKMKKKIKKVISKSPKSSCKYKNSSMKGKKK